MSRRKPHRKPDVFHPLADPVGAYVVGSLLASGVVGIAALIGWRDAVGAFLAAAGYLLFCVVMPGLLWMSPRAQPLFTKPSARAWFWWPFSLIATSPLWVACYGLADDWWTTPAWLRPLALTLLFGGQVPVLLGFLRLMDEPKR